MASSQITLFDALTGASTLVDAGDGGGASRMKSWLEEVPLWLAESVEPLALKGLGRGRHANFPGFLRGEQIPNFNGVSIFRVEPQSAVLALGDGSAVSIGAAALTEPDRTHANYFNTTTDPDDAVAPRGASAPAFLQTIVDAGGLDLSTSSGILTFRVNGTLYTVTGLIGTTTLVEQIQTAINTAGVPVDTAIEGGDTLRIFAPGNGITSNIEAVAVAGDVATVLFTGAGQSSQPNVQYRGTNGPLGVMGNVETVGSVKPQRRTLPGSVSVAATVGGSAVLVTDDGAGVLADATNTHTGTVNYVTGAISITYGTAPDNATNITATWKALKPLDLTDPARIPVGGLELALLVN